MPYFSDGMQWMQDQTCSYLWIPHGEALTCNPQIVHWLLSILAKKPESATARTLLRNCKVISKPVLSKQMDSFRKKLLDFEDRPTVLRAKTDEDLLEMIPDYYVDSILV